MFYTNKIPEIFNFTRKKCVNHDIFGKQLRMKDVLMFCQSFCKFLLKYKITLKNQARIWKNSQKEYDSQKDDDDDGIRVPQLTCIWSKWVGEAD